MRDYLPEVLKEVRELKAIVNTEEPEVSDLWEALEAALSDQFVSDTSEEGLKRYEKILKIIPKATDNIDERRFRVLARFNEQLPYTFRTLEERLRILCGEEGYSMTLKAEDYTLKVRIKLFAESSFDTVESLLNRIVPANLVIDLSLLYNTHRELARHTHGELSQYTHEELRRVKL